MHEGYRYWRIHIFTALFADFHIHALASFVAIRYYLPQVIMHSFKIPKSLIVSV